MKCPACFNELKPLQVGQVTVDVCQGGCGGIWFDNFELQRVDEQGEGPAHALLGVQRDRQTRVDPARKRDCPRCEGIKLRRHFYSARRRVEVDECPGCGGIWLDAGELEQIQAEQAQNANQADAAVAGASQAFIRYLYRLQSSQAPEE